jgi:hypothetical protein
VDQTLADVNGRSNVWLSPWLISTSGTTLATGGMYGTIGAVSTIDKTIGSTPKRLGDAP